MTSRDDEFMALAVAEARRGMRRGEGGPFGACIVKGGQVIATAHNRVLRTRNATQHAEIVAIGKACRALSTHVLRGCVIYSTTEPCPMCFSAIHWAQIDKACYGTTVPDVKRLGFNELTISNATLKRLGSSPVRLEGKVGLEACRALLREWAALPIKTTY